MRTVAAFLGEALDRIGAVDWAHARNENLDLAIACTAHELKGPLVGARAALDRVTVADEDPAGQELLRRSRDELGSLADLVDPLLRWSAGSSSLRLVRIDLVGIVRDVVSSCRLESDEPVGGPGSTAARLGPRRRAAAGAGRSRTSFATRWRTRHRGRPCR